MTNLLVSVVFGDVLETKYRKQLQQWMIEHHTGDNRIRAVAPQGWTVGDKTGTCAYGTTNDVGFIIPPQGVYPIIVSVFFTQDAQENQPNEMALQAVAHIALCAVGICATES